MEIIQTRSEIDAAENAFDASFRGLSYQGIHTCIGYQGGNYETDVMWIPSLEIWGFFGLPPNEKSSGERFWNPFGLGKPQSQVSIVCEINPPRSDINPATGGVFLKGPQGNTRVAHRGRFTVAGGMKTSFFRSHFQGKVLAATEGRRTASLFHVAVLQSSEFGQELMHFIKEVHRIKELRRK